MKIFLVILLTFVAPSTFARLHSNLETSQEIYGEMAEYSKLPNQNVYVAIFKEKKPWEFKCLFLDGQCEAVIVSCKDFITPNELTKLILFNCSALNWENVAPRKMSNGQDIVVRARDNLIIICTNKGAEFVKNFVESKWKTE